MTARSSAAALRRLAVVLLTGVALALAAPVAAAAAPLVVSLDFDDGAAEAYVAGGLLGSHGMRGTFYVNSDVIGDPGHLSWAQLAELQARGHEIAGHTRSHPRLPSLLATAGVAEVRHQVCGDQVELRRHGFDVTEFAYPFGAADDGVKAIVHDCGYRTGRTDRGIGVTSAPFAELIPPPDAYWTRTPPAPTKTTPLATLQDYVTRAEEGGGWLHIVFHRICDGCREYSTPEPVITGFLDWLDGRDTVVVKTAQQVMDEVWASDTSPPDTSIASAPAHVPVEGSPRVRVLVLGGGVALRVPPRRRRLGAVLLTGLLHEPGGRRAQLLCSRDRPRPQHGREPRPPQLHDRRAAPTAATAAARHDRRLPAQRDPLPEGAQAEGHRDLRALSRRALHGGRVGQHQHPGQPEAAAA